MKLQRQQVAVIANVGCRGRLQRLRGQRAEVASLEAIRQHARSDSAANSARLEQVRESVKRRFRDLQDDA